VKVWVYVEGVADERALQALWASWLDALRLKGRGIKIVPLDDKSRFFGKIGHRAAEKLCASEDDVVVGLPDLYPSSGFEHTPYRHSDLDELRNVQVRCVRKALMEVYGLSRTRADAALDRFLPSALKHDLEMLLLAAKEQLRRYLHTSDRLGTWRRPVEDQDQEHPPKRVVEDLFRTKSAKKRAYRDTRDASGILRTTSDIKAVLYDEQGRLQCPVFKEMLEWIGSRTGVPACS